MLSVEVPLQVRNGAKATQVQSDVTDSEQLELMAAASPDALVGLGPSHDIVMVNVASTRMFGYCRAQMLAKPIVFLLPAGIDAPLLAQRQANALGAARQQPRSFDVLGRQQDGGVVPLEATVTGVPLAHGIASIVALRERRVGTERHVASTEVRRLAAIVLSSEDAIIGMSLEGLVSSWNAGATRLFGYERAEMIGTPVAQLAAPGQIDAVPAAVARIAMGERVESFAAVHRRKDGSELDVSLTLSAIRDDAGTIIGASKVARDITLSKQAERALIHAREAAEAANRELEAFSYSVAHDLRTPLRAINGYSQALLADYRDKLDGEGAEFLKRMGTASLYMAHVIESLLLLAQLTKGERLHERVDLSALAQQSCDRLRSAEPQRAVDLHIAAHLEAEGDPLLLGIVFDNLFSNAWKFTAKCAVARIEFGQEEQAGVRVYFIRDTGAGFDMAFSSKLFGTFQRLHTTREFSGTGIGLATVQRVIQRHGGRIWATAAVNQGATFFFTLNEMERQP